MNTTYPVEPHAFDSFDQALVTELRHVVAERRTTPVRRTRRRSALVAASVAAVTAGVFGFSTLGTASAYAVSRTSTGDITISIHRLDDAAGLRKELASYGIDAQVSYRGSSGMPGHTIKLPEGITPQVIHPGPAGAGTGTSSATAASGPAGTTDAACGDPNNPPLTTDLRTDDYVITIPKGSALTRSDSQLLITTSGDVKSSLAGLAVAYTIGGVECGFGSLTAGAGQSAP